METETRTGTKIVLPEDRWLHIQDKHPELKESLEAILDTVKNPVRLLEGDSGESVIGCTILNASKRA